MSIKSLLQIILFLLIVIILGGIYFLYFYSGPLKNKEAREKLLELSETNKVLNNAPDQEILEEVNINKKNEQINIEKKQNEIMKDKTVNNKLEIKLNDNLTNQNKKVVLNDDDNDKDNLENLTKGIEYISSNENGDIFKILAKLGRTNLKNNNILDLENVSGSITSKEKSNIYITSRFAQYNYSSQNSKFYKDVKIKYEDKIIICDNLDLNISKNIAVAYNNVIIEDNRSSMKAQRITMDMITKDIKINSKDNIEVTTN